MRGDKSADIRLARRQAKLGKQLGQLMSTGVHDYPFLTVAEDGTQ